MFTIVTAFTLRTDFTTFTSWAWRSLYTLWPRNTLRASFTLRTGLSIITARTSRTLRPDFTRITLWTRRSLYTLWPRNTLRASFTLRTGISFRARYRCTSCRYFKRFELFFSKVVKCKRIAFITFWTRFTRITFNTRDTLRTR